MTSLARKALLELNTTSRRRGGVADYRDLRETKADRVYGALRSAILSGDLPPEAPIDKGEICERLGVSRLPVTTAINRLAFERLVVVEPQSGSYVSRISLSDMKEWMLVRLALEVEIASASAKLPKDWIEKLERNIAYQGTAVARDDLTGFHEFDNGFHNLMLEGLGLPRVGEILAAARTHVDRTRRMLLPEPGRMPATYEEHRAIYRMIAAGRPAGAGQAMRRHLNRVLGELEVFAKRHPNFFTP